MIFGCGPRYNIGIDVGGTNTDGVLYDCIEKKIAAAVKIPTEHSSYAKAIDRSLGALIKNCGDIGREIVSLNISTTVSTNALLEGRGQPSNLILIGFEKYPHIVSDIEAAIKPLSILKVSGGHSGWGKEREHFDNYAVEKFAGSRAGELFTVSSLYSPRNPEHETAAQKILISNGSGHVTCSHELSYSKLNSVKRTVTAYLNTSLVPVATRLLDDINSMVKKYKISCPVMFLKSDSTLVPSEWCRKFPIEMIYSGPAASLRGACFIAEEFGCDSFLVADIGGTSTDIGRIENGRTVFSEEGARIGSYRTMIPSLDITSIALGGDSGIKISGEEIVVGPERAVPLCRISEETNISSVDFTVDSTGSYVSEDSVSTASANNHFDGRPEGLSDSSEPVKKLFPSGEYLNGLCTDKCRIKEFSYTLTDVFNTMGLSDVGDPEISKAASCVFGKKYNTAGFDFAEQVSVKANSMLECSIMEYESKCGAKPRVYVGTPAEVFAKLGIDRGLRVIVPKNFDVAGAAGAAVSSIELSCRIFIMHSFSNDSFTSFLPESTVSSDNFQELFYEAEEAGKDYLSKLAAKTGFPEITIIVKKDFSYVGQTENVASLLSVSMEFRAVADIV